MKKIILLMSIFAIVNLNAKSRSEMISQDLSKLGVSQEIILKTIELDKEMPNVVSEPDREKVKKLALKIEELLKKNEKNFVLSENLINIYNALGKSDAEKLNNLKRYEKYNPYEVSKLFFSNMYYSNKGDFDSYNKNYEILKEKYPDYLITRIAVTYTIGEDAIWNVMQTDEKAALASLNSIMKMCDDKKKTEESHISDEQAWAYKLTMGWFAISFYLNENRTQDAIDFYYKNFEGKNKPDKEILDYSKYQNWFIKSELARANKNDFYNNKKLFEENLKKITNTKLYRELEKFGKVIVVNK